MIHNSSDVDLAIDENGVLVFMTEDMMKETSYSYDREFDSSCSGRTQSGLLSFPRTVEQLWIDLLEEQDTKYLTVYSVLLLCWILGELAWGCWASNIAFVSDATHMLFDVFCVSTCMCSMLLNRELNARSFTFSYGFDRLEVLCGFVNAALLVLASFLLVADAVHRTMYDDYSHCQHQKPLILPFYSLAINVAALALIRVRHPEIGRTHATVREYGGRHINLGGLALHMLSDALESGGNILAAFLASRKGWVWADVTLSVAAACLVVLCAYPILRDASEVLLHSTPTELHTAGLTRRLHQVDLVEGVTGHCDARFWSVSPGTVIGSLRVMAEENAEEAFIQALNPLD